LHNEELEYFEKPRQIANTAYALYILKKIGLVDGAHISQYLKHQSKIGAFRNSDGFNDWRDISFILGWNHYSFLLLSEMEHTDENYVPVEFEDYSETGQYAIHENNNIVEFYREEKLVAGIEKKSGNLTKYKFDTKRYKLKVITNPNARVELIKDNMVKYAEITSPDGYCYLDPENGEFLLRVWHPEYITVKRIVTVSEKNKTLSYFFQNENIP